jgi:hypothetical protein
MFGDRGSNPPDILKQARRLAKALSKPEEDPGRRFPWLL